MCLIKILQIIIVTGLWSLGDLKETETIVLTTKVMPEALGKNLIISSKIQQLMVSNSSDDKSSLISPSRNEILTITNQTNNNGTGLPRTSPYINPTAKADINSGLYNINKIVTLSMNKAGNITIQQMEKSQQKPVQNT